MEQAAKPAAGVLTRALDNLINNVLKGTEKGLHRQAEALGTAYRTQLINTVRRVSEIKNLLYRQRPAQLRDIYVPPSLQQEHEIISAQDLFRRFYDLQRIVVTGPAGFGKSVLLKYLCLTHADDQNSRIPLFIELRKIPEKHSTDLVDALHAIYNDPSKPTTKTTLVSALKRGLFTVILDGFDEVSRELRSPVEDAILDFSIKYPSCPLVVSGRRDFAFSSWEQFHVYEIMPMSKETAIELISRLEYSESLKKKFVTKAIPVLFENKDKSFVQTPLLAVLMLLTYEIYADVPKQMHIFYSHAFETLLRGHDATKSQFQRSLKSPVSDDEFKRTFASFCAMTYAKGAYRFSKEEVLQNISRALGSICSDADVETFLEDLVGSVCVLQLEGFEYSFVHRSFQEYFTAVFLRVSAIDVVDKFLTYRYPQYDETVIPMLIDMDRDRLEKEWVLPRLSTLLDAFGRDTKQATLKRLLSDFWVELRFSQSDGELRSLAGPQSAEYRSIVALERMYPPEGGEYGAAWIDKWQRWHDRVRVIFECIQSGDIPHELLSVGQKEKRVPFDGSDESLEAEDLYLSFDQKYADVWKRAHMLEAATYLLSYYIKLEAQVRRRVESRDRFVEEVF